MLGRRDLSAPRSYSSYCDPAATSLDSQSSEGPNCHSYIMSLKQQLRDELRSVTEQRAVPSIAAEDRCWIMDLGYKRLIDHNANSRRRITGPDLSGLLSHSSWTDTHTAPSSWARPPPLAEGQSSTGSSASWADTGGTRLRHQNTPPSSDLCFLRQRATWTTLYRYKLYREVAACLSSLSVRYRRPPGATDCTASTRAPPAASLLLQ
ncbi:hypothetical protein AVEN_205954-1 [Araneus ventricosus]|uniref:Uncharacterized protein n=1 Tax=Araneus ventricosus TaxID=182803 RepID=A0A4Y2SMA0_ARAVE|nr:hypothetical protein AVEN_205954-1 [Araneus ventricosus]